MGVGGDQDVDREDKKDGIDDEETDQDEDRGGKKRGRTKTETETRTGTGHRKNRHRGDTPRPGQKDAHVATVSWTAPGRTTLTFSVHFQARKGLTTLAKS